MEGQGQVGAYAGLEGGTAAAQRSRGLGNGVCCGPWTGCRLTLGAQPSGLAQGLSLRFLEASCLLQPGVYPNSDSP